MSSPRREGQLLSLIDELRGEREELRVELRSRAESKPKRSVFPTTPQGWAIGVAAVLTALGTAGAAVLTSIGGGAGLAAVLHAPELRAQLEQANKNGEACRKDVADLRARLNQRQELEAVRWLFVEAAFCKAGYTAKGVNCDGVTWEARPLPKRGEALQPWRARTDWPALPEVPK